MTDDVAVMIAFAEARLGEDEASAERHAIADGEWVRYICDPVVGAFGGQTRFRNVARGFYVAAMSDPDRVLRDVAAKRARIERYKRAVAVGGTSPSPFTRGQDNGYAEACLDSIRDDVAAWSDHPDYQQGWKP